MFRIQEIVNSIFTSKTYIIYKEGKRLAWLVDIGDVEPVMAFLKENKLTVAGVFLTHGHFDHMYGLPALMEQEPEAKIYATAYTREVIASTKLNLSKYNETPVSYPGDNVLVVQEGDKLQLFEGEAPMECYETPGHNPGCLTMVLADKVFTGDAYIPGIGVNTTVPKSDKVLAVQSADRILKLAEGRAILPGHQIDNYLRLNG